MNLLSRVNNFIRTTEGAVNPDCFLFLISTSSGQGSFFWLVIIESTECSIIELKSVVFDNTSAGRLLVLEESVNGNGTTTTSNGL
jgi:hypothetical protein